MVAQVKYERETRIKVTEVPQTAIDFVKKYNKEQNKIRWYLEQSLNRKSFEAKYKNNNNQYSIEFDLEGNLEDIEIKIKQDNIEQNSLVVMNRFLSEQCDRYKIRKIQSQYINSTNELTLEDIEQGKTPDNFELIVKCKRNNDIHLFEYLFDTKGKFISEAKIIFKNAVNLEY